VEKDGVLLELALAITVLLSLLFALAQVPKGKEQT